MKKANFLLAILLILSAIPTLGQSIFKTEWYVGGGGDGLSTYVLSPNYYGEPALDSKMTFSYAINLNLGIDYNEHWGLKLEIGYAALGQKFDGTQYNLAANRTISLNYVMIPLMIKYRVGCEKVKFYVMAGPQLGLLMSATQDYQRGGADAPDFNCPGVGMIEVSKKDIAERLTDAGGYVRADLGVELTPSKHFMIDIGLTSAYCVTDLNNRHWRMLNIDKKYNISHNFYGGLNIGFNYRW